MDNFSGCICHFLTTLLDNVNQALGRSDGFTTPNDLGPLSSLEPGGGDPGSLFGLGSSSNEGVSSSHVVAFMFLVIVILSLFQGPGNNGGGGTGQNTKPGRSGGGGDSNSDGPDPSVS